MIAIPLGFEISMSARDDGTVKSLYVRMTNGKVVRTKEILRDELLADYDSHGTLVGIEVLAPVKLSAMIKLVSVPRREIFERVMRHTAPGELVLRR